MLPKERVLAALEGREPDRIPWGEHFVDYNVYEDILGRPSLMHAKFRETQALWDGRRDEVVADYKRDTVDFSRAMDMDLVPVYRVPDKDARPEPMEKVSEGVYRNRAGSIYHVSDTTHDLRIHSPAPRTDYTPPTVESIQQQIDEFDDDDIGDPNDSRWELVHHAVKELGDERFIVLLCDDLGWPSFGQTEEDFWMNLVLEPEISLKLAELKGKRLLRDAKLYGQLGIDGITPCGDLGSSTSLMANPTIYRERILPVHRVHAAAAHAVGLKILKHCCGHVWPIIEEFAEVYDAYEGIQGTAGMDIAKLGEQVGDRLCLWGGIWHEHIILGSLDDIRNDARAAFGAAAKGARYIMGSSHSLAVDAKAKNILEMKRLRDTWGVYPLNPAKFV